MFNKFIEIVFVVTRAFKPYIALVLWVWVTRIPPQFPCSQLKNHSHHRFILRLILLEMLPLVIQLQPQLISFSNKVGRLIQIYLFLPNRDELIQVIFVCVDISNVTAFRTVGLVVDPLAHDWASFKPEFQAQSTKFMSAKLSIWQVARLKQLPITNCTIFILVIYCKHGLLLHLPPWWTSSRAPIRSPDEASLPHLGIMSYFTHLALVVLPRYLRLDG